MKSSRHTRVLGFDFVINTLLTVVEYTAGVVSGSAAILADGSQNLTDSLVITVAYVCEHAVARPHLSKRTIVRIYRLATAFNAVILMTLAVCIGTLGVNRTLHPQTLNNTLVIAIGITSIIINFWAAGLLFTARRDTAVTAPYIGLLFSGLSGIGVLASGLVSQVWQVHQIDGIIGVIIAGLLFVRSGRMLAVALLNPQKLLQSGR